MEESPRVFVEDSSLDDDSFEKQRRALAALDQEIERLSAATRSGSDLGIRDDALSSFMSSSRGHEGLSSRHSASGAFGGRFGFGAPARTSGSFSGRGNGYRLRGSPPRSVEVASDAGRGDVGRRRGGALRSAGRGAMENREPGRVDRSDTWTPMSVPARPSKRRNRGNLSRPVDEAQRARRSGGVVDASVALARLEREHAALQERVEAMASNLDGTGNDVGLRGVSGARNGIVQGLSSAPSPVPPGLGIDRRPDALEEALATVVADLGEKVQRLQRQRDEESMGGKGGSGRGRNNDYPPFPPGLGPPPPAPTSVTVESLLAEQARIVGQLRSAEEQEAKALEWLPKGSAAYRAQQIHLEKMASTRIRVQDSYRRKIEAILQNEDDDATSFTTDTDYNHALHQARQQEQQLLEQRRRDAERQEQQHRGGGRRRRRVTRQDNHTDDEEAESHTSSMYGRDNTFPPKGLVDLEHSDIEGGGGMEGSSDARSASDFQQHHQQRPNYNNIASNEALPAVGMEDDKELKKSDSFVIQKTKSVVEAPDQTQTPPTKKTEQSPTKKTEQSSTKIPEQSPTENPKGRVRVRFDGLQGMSGSGRVRIVWCLYKGSKPVGSVGALREKVVLKSGECRIAETVVLEGVTELEKDLFLVVEIQTGRRFRPLGWTAVRICGMPRVESTRLDPGAAPPALSSLDGDAVNSDRLAVRTGAIAVTIVRPPVGGPTGQLDRASLAGLPAVVTSSGVSGQLNLYIEDLALESRPYSGDADLENDADDEDEDEDEEDEREKKEEYRIVSLAPNDRPGKPIDFETASFVSLEDDDVDATAVSRKVQRLAKLRAAAKVVEERGSARGKDGSKLKSASSWAKQALRKPRSSRSSHTSSKKHEEDHDTKKHDADDRDTLGEIADVETPSDSEGDETKKRKDQDDAADDDDDVHSNGEKDAKEDDEVDFPPEWFAAPPKVDNLPGVVETLGSDAELPWVRASASVSSRCVLAPGEGFTVAVDAARFLPDNVLLSKVVFKAMLPTYEVVGSDIAAVADLDSEMLSPTFSNAVRSFGASPRGEAWDPGLSLIFRVDTLESHTHEPQVAGYAVLNVFTVAKAVEARWPPNTKQPSTVEEALLNAGAFQLPLYQGPPDRHKVKLSSTALDETGVPRVPCASLLVRVIRGADHMPRRPSYSSGAYDSLRCLPSTDEVNLYPKRADLTSPTLREAIQFFASDQGADSRFGTPPAPGSPDAVLRRWCDARMAAAPSRMLDFGFLCPFDPDEGIEIAVDGAQNLPQGLLAPGRAVVAIISLAGIEGATPTVTVQRLGNSLPLELSTALLPPLGDRWTAAAAIHWASSDAAPRFGDGFLAVGGTSFQPRLAAFIELWAVDLTGRGLEEGPAPPSPLEPLRGRAARVAWTLVPVFDAQGEGYVRRQALMAPLFAGNPPDSLWAALAVCDSIQQEVTNRVAAAAAGNAKGGRLFPSYASLFIRTRDPQIAQLRPVRASRYGTNLVPQPLRAKFTTADTRQETSLAETVLNSLSIAPDTADVALDQFITKLAEPIPE